jgi:hypothetical protein
MSLGVRKYYQVFLPEKQYYDWTQR